MHEHQPCSIYINYPFHALQVSGKLGSKLGQKLTNFPKTFPNLWAPAPTVVVFNLFFH